MFVFTFQKCFEKILNFFYRFLYFKLLFLKFFYLKKYIKKSLQFILKNKYKSEKATIKKFNWVWLLGLEVNHPY